MDSSSSREPRHLTDPAANMRAAAALFDRNADRWAVGLVAMFARVAEAMRAGQVSPDELAGRVYFTTRLALIAEPAVRVAVQVSYSPAVTAAGVHRQATGVGVTAYETLSCGHTIAEHWTVPISAAMPEWVDQAAGMFARQALDVHRDRRRRHLSAYN